MAGSPGWALLGLFSAAMAVDLAATVRTIAKINRQLDQIDQLAQRLIGCPLREEALRAAVRRGKSGNIFRTWTCMNFAG